MHAETTTTQERTQPAEDAFTGVLEEFLHGRDSEVLGIGAVQRIESIREFERRYSRQRVVHLEGERGARTVYVKIYKNVYRKPADAFDAKIRRDFETNRFWYDRLEPHREFGSIKPLYYSQPFHAIISEETHGQNLGELVRSQMRLWPAASVRDALQSHMRNTGRLLRALQAQDEHEMRFDVDELVEDVDRRMRMLIDQPGSGFSAGLRESILAFYARNRAEVEQSPCPVGYMHRDFMMGNLLIDGERIIIHDFAKIDIGPAYFDLARFYHNLGLLMLKPVYRARNIMALQRAFLQGYDSPDISGPDDLRFKIFLLRHYITHYKGLIRDQHRSARAAIYDRYVRAKHLQHIRQIIGR